VPNNLATLHGFRAVTESISFMLIAFAKTSDDADVSAYARPQQRSRGPVSHKAHAASRFSPGLFLVSFGTTYALTALPLLLAVTTPLLMVGRVQMWISK